MVARLAFQKAQDVALRTSDKAVIIGCDTVAECQGQILGKPANRDHAREMLTLMSGRVHHVCVTNTVNRLAVRWNRNSGVNQFTKFL